MTYAFISFLKFCKVILKHVDYWNKRSNIIEILNYLCKAEYIDNMEHWKECAHEAFILKNLVDNDNI